MTLLCDTFLLPLPPPDRLTADDVSEIARLCALVLAVLLLVVGNVPTATESTQWRTPPPQDADVSVIWDMDSSELLDDLATEEHTWNLQELAVDWRVVENDHGEEAFTITEVELVSRRSSVRAALRGLRFPGSIGLQSIVSVECTQRSDGAEEDCVQVWPRSPAEPDYLFGVMRSMLMLLTAFPANAVDCSRRADILVLGMGMGTIPSMINNYLPEWTVDVVELDHVMVEHYRDFGLAPPTTSRTPGGWRVFADDAAHFVIQDQCKGWKYDTIIVDLAGKDDLTPAFVRTEEFIAAARGCLAKTGVIIVQMLGNVREVSHLASIGETVYQFTEVFRHTYIMEAGWYNRLLIAHDHLEEHVTGSQLMANSISRSDLCRTPYFTWGRGYLHPTASTPDWPSVLSRNLHHEEGYLPNY